jgi:hypothetical protein
MQHLRVNHDFTIVLDPKRIIGKIFYFK